MKVWAIKRISDGKYFSANGNSSSAPSVYLTQGKAEGRCKQITFCTDKVWEVVEWTITESAVVESN